LQAQTDTKKDNHHGTIVAVGGAVSAVSHANDPDWEARSQMNKVWKGQRSFYKYDVTKGDFYKFSPDTPDVSRKDPAK